VHPHPSSFPLTANPLRSRRQLAALLGMHYALTRELAAAYPRIKYPV
jgi:hypothetical protein